MGVVKEKTRRSIYINKEVGDKLDELAKRDNRSFNGYINVILSNHTNTRSKPKLLKKREAA